MRLPGAVGIDSRDRRGVRRGASEILTSLMLVYVANLGMDYVVHGPGAIRRACYASIIFFGRESSKAMYPLSPSRQRASDLDQIAGHAQGIMLRRVPRYARSIGANESRQLYRCRPQKDKGLPNAKIVNLARTWPQLGVGWS